MSRSSRGATIGPTAGNLFVREFVFPSIAFLIQINIRLGIRRN
jgi:hypothetical protein